MMYCKICGTPLIQGDVFCRNCGASNTNMESDASNTEEKIEVFETEPLVDETLNEEIENDLKIGESEGKKGDYFLVIIGIIIGILSIAIIGYLIYNLLQEKNNHKENITVLTQDDYNVIFGDYNFDLSSQIRAVLGNRLDLRAENWTARLGYSLSSSFSKLTVDNIRQTFEKIIDYRIGEITSKNYGGLSCFEGEVNYPDGTRTGLLICDRETGYWYVEYGTTSYVAYPTSDVSSEIARLIQAAKKVEPKEEQFKIADVEIVLE